MIKKKIISLSSNELKLQNLLIKMRNICYLQIDKMKLLTYTEEEIFEIGDKLHKEGIRKVFEEFKINKEELKKYRIWETFRTNEIYYKILIDYIKQNL